MWGAPKRRRSRGAAFLLLGLLAGALASCGEEDFERQPRPPVPVQLTGVIQLRQVTISPNEVGAGPIIITVSNQTESSHTVTLEGDAVRERVGPVNPGDTATIQATLNQGTYEVRAGSEAAVPVEIQPGELIVGAERRSSNNDTLLP